MKVIITARVKQGFPKEADLSPARSSDSHAASFWKRVIRKSRSCFLAALVFVSCENAFSLEPRMWLTTVASGDLYMGRQHSFTFMDQLNDARSGVGQVNSDGFVSESGLSTSAVAQIQVAAGQIHAQANTVTNGGAMATATADASVLDYITVNSPTEKGVGIMKAVLYYQLSMFEVVKNGSYTSGGASLSVRFGNEVIARSASLVNGHSTKQIYGGGESFEEIVLVTKFQFGQPLYYLTNLRLDAIARNGATMLVDAGKSLYWGGVYSVTVDGKEAQDYSAVGAGGIDYRISYLPIPEPKAAALFILGATLLLIYASRRRVGGFL